MKPSIACLMAAGVLSLSACAMIRGDQPAASTATDAAIGAAIGGVAGAVWADRNGDGRVDGYISNGRYYAGTPAGYVPAGGPEPVPPAAKS